VNANGGLWEEWSVDGEVEEDAESCKEWKYIYPYEDSIMKPTEHCL
jgi:hypothetical protein